MARWFIKRWVGWWMELKILIIM